MKSLKDLYGAFVEFDWQTEADKGVYTQSELFGAEAWASRRSAVDLALKKLIEVCEQTCFCEHPSKPACKFCEALAQLRHAVTSAGSERSEGLALEGER